MTPDIISQPTTSYKLLAGIEQIIDAVRPTIGPIPRLVAVNNAHQPLPELLDSAALIARRIFALSERSEDVGAMYLRHLLWKQQEAYGDGTATTALIFHHIFAAGLRYIAAGGNAQSLKRHLLANLDCVLAAFDRQIIPANSQAHYANFARSAGANEALSQALAQILDVIGAYGRLEVVDGHSKNLDWTFVEGMQWNSGVHHKEMLPPNSALALVEPAILLTDQKIDNPLGLAPAMMAAHKNGYRSLVMIAPEISAGALGFIHKNNQERRDVFQIIANRIPGNTEAERFDALDDIAVITGATPILGITGRTLSAVTVEDLGSARRVQVSEKYLGIIGGNGDPRARQQLAVTLKNRYENAQPEAQSALQLRLGRLSGGTAVLSVGANSLAEMEEIKDIAKTVFPQLQRASLSGIIAGGGSAFLTCKSTLMQSHQHISDTDERVARNILAEALTMPTLQILENAGLEARPFLHHIEAAGQGYGADARTGEIIHMQDFGIIDSAAIWRSALEMAVRSAALALTVDVIVHHRKAEISLEP